MNEKNNIVCPKCGEIIPLDGKYEKAYAEIVKQIRDKEFKNELKKQLDKDEKSIRSELKIEHDKELSDKDKAIFDLTIEVQNLRGELDSKGKEKEMAVKEAVSVKENEIARLNEKISNIEELNSQKNHSEITKYKLRIQELESEAKVKEKEKKAAIKEAVSDARTEEKEKYEKKLEERQAELLIKDKEVNELNNKLVLADFEKERAVLKFEKERDELKQSYDFQLKSKDEEINRYKENKTRLSTKMLGESLERYCENQFNIKLAPYLPNGELKKDNIAIEGTKGDFIFREKDENGNEMLSIMFEMKNEMETTVSKHKNEDFFAKLDSDRKKKKCEYAVLVTMLEQESELDNYGIVKAWGNYEKMYLIRPQFFIPMINILRDAAYNSQELKCTIEVMKNQEIDITHFEERIEDFKTAFSKNYDLAGRQFNTAIEEIDKTIEHLNKVKDNLQKSLNNLRLANNKAQTQLTIKALTKDNDTMIEMFEQLGNAPDGDE